MTAAYDVKPTSGTYRQVVERYRYTPYGQAIILDANFAVGAANGTISAIGNNYLYTGRERDPETGLQLNRWRYYHPGLGRWLTQDPIGYEGSEWNLYEYVGGMPLNFQDPDGLQIGMEYGTYPLYRLKCIKYNWEMAGYKGVEDCAEDILNKASKDPKFVGGVCFGVGAGFAIPPIAIGTSIGLVFTIVIPFGWCNQCWEYEYERL